MSKRFTDTDKWKKRFIKSLEGAYKLLWLYICDDCDHAGIWHVDFDIAQIYVNMPVNEKDALKYFKGKVFPFDDNEKWLIPSFIEFQYGKLNPQNRAHNSVIEKLEKYKIKGLITSLQGRKDKDKDKDKVQRRPKTLLEVESHFFKLKIESHIMHAGKFWNFYEANGWVQGKGKKPIVNWKACVNTWKLPKKISVSEEWDKQLTDP